MNIKSIFKWLFSTQKHPLPVLRPAKPEDIQVIFDLCLLQAKRGHFNNAYLEPAIQPGLMRQIACAIADMPVPMPGKRDGARARIFTLEKDKTPIGFTMLLEDEPGSWNERSELFLVALSDEHKGQGTGKQMVTSLLSTVPSKVIYARCFKNSIKLKSHLLDLGFKQVSISKAGTVTLELTR